MLARTAIALVLLAPPAVSAQELDTAFSALVRISGTRGDTPVRGSGFVVFLERDKATIVTASHVIAGLQKLEVSFAVDSTLPFPDPSVLGMDSADDSKGLAVLQVRGALPAGVTSLSLEVETRPQPGEELFLLGFPRLAATPRTTRRALSAWSGTLLLIDQGVEEGFSGGPVLKAGKVVGVITNTDDQNTYAVNARVVREALEGWGVKLGGQSGQEGASNVLPPSPTPQGAGKCVREERNENGMVFVRICPGTFMMGSFDNDPQADVDEKPAHQVTLSEFWIGKAEVYNYQYRRFRPDHQGEDAWPVTVNWAEAQEACKYFGGRLPTEAEWEYAARAGTKSAWSFGSDEKLLGEYAWYGDKLGSAPHPAGKKKPNAWGLHDMHGNVLEWVADWYGSYPSAALTDPPGPKTSGARVARGGSSVDRANSLRSASRAPVSPETLSMYIGFRCVLSSGRQP